MTLVLGCNRELWLVRWPPISEAPRDGTKLCALARGSDEPEIVFLDRIMQAWAEEDTTARGNDIELWATDLP